MSHSDVGIHLASTGRPILSALDLIAVGTRWVKEMRYKKGGEGEREGGRSEKCGRKSEREKRGRNREGLQK